jgi:hypothetical protein
MKKSVWSGICAAMVCTLAIAVAAQTTPPPTQTPSSSSANKVTITGCIERASSPTGTPGSTGTSGSASAGETKFVLNTQPAGSGAAGTSGTGTSTSGTSSSSSPSASSSASAKSYRLDADDSQLTPHVGHKVEITGTVEGGASTSSTTSSSSSASSSSTATAPKLKVDSVKMIASSCS